ncbi:ANTAR domain-containing protein [Geodermatophilus sp. SYSU D00742]
MTDASEPPRGGSHPPAPRLPAQEALDRLADLEVAHEELRVAEEEVRVQQAQIEQLLARYEAERRWRGQLSGLVSVALCVTDGTGRLVDANPALADLLHVPLHLVRGKPLSVFLGAGHAQSFRTAVGDLTTRGALERRLRVTVRGRRAEEEVPVDLFGFPEDATAVGSAAHVQWALVLVPDKDTVGHVGTAGTVSVIESLGLAAALAELSAMPVVGEDRQRLLTRMAALVRSAVPAAAAVSITLGSPLEPQQLGTDSTLAQELDGRQMHAEEGPCWEALVTGTLVVTPDVTTDERWPRLQQTLGDTTVRAVLAIPLHDGEQAVGVVNVYAEEVAAFGPDSRRIAELVAAAVGGVLQSASERQALRDLAANLEKALTSRAVIDQAKGVLMARLGVDADDAFARLVTLSNRLNVKLRDLAQLVVSGHADEVIAVSGP